MHSDEQRDREIAEIQRRMDYLRTTDQIPLTEKIEILRSVLEIIEANEARRNLDSL